MHLSEKSSVTTANQIYCLQSRRFPISDLFRTRSGRRQPLLSLWPRVQESLPCFQTVTVLRICEVSVFSQRSCTGWGATPRRHVPVREEGPAGGVGDTAAHRRVARLLPLLDLIIVVKLPHGLQDTHKLLAWYQDIGAQSGKVRTAFKGVSGHISKLKHPPSCSTPLCSVLLVLGMDSRASHMPSACSTTELHPQPRPQLQRLQAVC